ncbi:hypothetical protein QEH56_14675 [Pelagicoccus enzymogenes]|uniref:hypothetical protein n=1 Tax=Pelagicoccus enzymogenes TaxID=2773457 RepID=UPI00280CE061|nr:hypothetical protein [Pelagicoccus enzymogenes]MDQ8199408.1 hypothetical protein [Pelagicoccus enzymogenes]
MAQGASGRGEPAESIVRLDVPVVDGEVHGGGLPLAMGVESIQVMRANRSYPELADTLGWTYNHAPMLAYAHGHFYLEYLSSPFSEHAPPGVTLVTRSSDGRNWEQPTVVFPTYFVRPGSIYSTDTGAAMMHQRMGFYLAPNGKLLVLGHYGHAPSPYGDKGIGRVVREAKADGSYGPIYFVRYNILSGANESNTRYPLYSRSPDAGFVAACDSLLQSRLTTMQWFDEDRSEDGFYTAPSVDLNGKALEAPSVYHRKDGAVVAMFKHGWAALSRDEGASWSEPSKVLGMITGGAKTWVQRTADDRFALVYNPAKQVRWPLVVATSDEGIVFDDMLLVNGEVPPRRFFGRAKDKGMQYTRGIAEGNGTPPGDDLWITYSSNKEDIWVSRIPVPIRSRETKAVREAFDDREVGGPVANWNTYSPKWASVSIAAFPSEDNRSLRLEDREPYDYAKAQRLFPEAKEVEVTFNVFRDQFSPGNLEIEVLDRQGRRPVRLFLADNGQLKVADGKGERVVAHYSSGQWHELSLDVDTAKGRFDLRLDGREIARGVTFAESVDSVERLSLRTGAFRTEPTRSTSRYGVMEDLGGADNPVPQVTYYIDDVVVD